MRVVNVKDFCIPSDENDYDELVSFADTMASIPQFDAVPIEVLDKIRAEIKKQILESLLNDNKNWFVAEKVNECLEIIDKYKAEKER